MFHYVELVSLYVNVGWAACFALRLLKHDFSFLQADSKSEGLGCLCKAIDNLEGFLCVRLEKRSCHQRAGQGRVLPVS